MTGFKDDVYKYASGAKAPYIQHVIEHSPKFAGKIIKYENFGESGFRSREMKEAFDIVEKAMIVRRIYSSASLEIPLIENQKKSPKILFLDTGLVNYSLGVREELFTTEELNNVFQGQIAEQTVGQALQTLANTRKYEFAYWFRDKKSAVAEIDFLFQFKSGIFPIEVKSGKNGRLKSLHLFMSESNTPLAVRIHAGNLILQDIQRPDGSIFRLISLPFYLVYRLEDILASIPVY